MKFDLHVHTSKSFDSLLGIEAIAKRAKRKGLDGIALTDHEKVCDEPIEALEKRFGIWIIPGVEVRTEVGDIIGLFIAEMVVERSAELLIDAIHWQGGWPFCLTPSNGMRIIQRLF